MCFTSDLSADRSIASATAAITSIDATIATAATTPTTAATATTAPLQPHACAFDFRNRLPDFQNEVWTVRVAHATIA